MDVISLICRGYIVQPIAVNIDTFLGLGDIGLINSTEFCVDRVNHFGSKEVELRVSGRMKEI
jgi:hypothetical protein